jgi:arabinogalactan oligomer / maltooligosaccharide transport system permease protein
MDSSGDRLMKTAKKVHLELSTILRIALLVVVDIALIWFIAQLMSNGFFNIAIVLIIIVIFNTYVFLAPKAYPLRWMAVGLSALLLFAIFPIIYTTYVAFTNYGDGHLLTKVQALEQIQRELYLPEEGRAFEWIAFRSAEGEYLLWIKDVNGNTNLVRQTDADYDEHILEVILGENGIGELDDDGAPLTIEGFTRLNRIQAATDTTLTQIKFGDPEKTIQVRSPSEAAELLPRFLYNEEEDTFTDQVTGIVYFERQGTYTSQQGRTLTPGFRANVGFENFEKFLTNPALRGPLAIILTWNFAFAFLSVFLTFALGLAISILYGDPNFPGKKILRSLLIIPYTIPSLITILIWRGILNENIGIVNTVLRNLINYAPAWTTNQWWAKAAVLIVNLWLGYPYFMLVTSGALQSIPSDIYEAAEVDGARGWNKFWNITLPLLLVAVGPLLIASFIFNFNNFNLIYVFIQGGPPIPGASTRAGYTDILISYVYNLAFEGGRGVNYGFASAISIVIFIFIALMALAQFKFTNMWEEVSENV